MINIKRYKGKLRRPLHWRWWVLFVRRGVFPMLAAAVLLLAVRFLLVMQCAVPASDPQSGLSAGDRLLVWLPAYGFHLPGSDHELNASPSPGDVVLFRTGDGRSPLSVGMVKRNALPDESREPAVCIGDSIIVPERRIEGRAFCVSYSLDSEKSFFKSFRKGRFFLRK